ncbi:hypothetical protein PRIPAC_83510 [Pristionchus pacificus]|uniref:Uncharacterized protein n=1 Tax=Pristionchus pacificus TaxID=54126 RepID=A0A2A6BKC5_PRIPA|nr:hypothetical protein PRIPAC_83510 [Pristionchus pacificus]|eukprot:PDM66365.1 hypothetical protein PRIPAC_47782 [Pristionchus pacificus]
MTLTHSVAVTPMNDRFDEEFKVEDDESKAALSDTPNSPMLLDWETREGLPADEYNHLGWLHPADYTFPSSDCVAQEYNADMFKMAVAPVDARETYENCLAPTNQHSTRRRHSATEEMMEQLGPRPSLDALRLIAKSPLSAERQLGQRLLEERGRKDKLTCTARCSRSNSAIQMPSRLSDVSFLHVDLRAPLRERNEEDNKVATDPQEQDHPLRRVTITRSGEGGATRVVIRRQSKSHVVVSLPLSPLQVYDD